MTATVYDFDRAADLRAQRNADLARRNDGVDMSRLSSEERRQLVLGGDRDAIRESRRVAFEKAYVRAHGRKP